MHISMEHLVNLIFLYFISLFLFFIFFLELEGSQSYKWHSMDSPPKAYFGLPVSQI